MTMELGALIRDLHAATTSYCWHRSSATSCAILSLLPKLYAESYARKMTSSVCQVRMK